MSYTNNNTSNASAVTVKFLPTKGTFKNGENKGQPVGMWLSLSKPYKLDTPAIAAIKNTYMYQVQSWNEVPSLDQAGTNFKAGATENLYYLGPVSVFGRSDVQQGIMEILSRPGSLRVALPPAKEEKSKAAPQSAGAVYQLLGAPQVAPQQVVPQPQVAPAYQPQFLNYNLPQAPAPQPAPQPAAPQAVPAKFIRIG